MEYLNRVEIIGSVEKGVMTRVSDKAAVRISVAVRNDDNVDTFNVFAVEGGKIRKEVLTSLEVGESVSVIGRLKPIGLSYEIVAQELEVIG